MHTASYGFSSEFNEYLGKRFRSSAGRGTITGRVLLEGKTVHISDVKADPGIHLDRSASSLAAIVRCSAFRSCAKGLAHWGDRCLNRSHVQPFTDKQIELASTFADQAVIAIENVRLFDEVQARTRELSESLEQQTATSEMLQVISSSPGELEPVFETLLANAIRLCGAKFGTLNLYDGDVFRIAAVYNVPSAFAATRHDPFVPIREVVTPRSSGRKRVMHIA